MNCAICDTDKFILPAAAYTEELTPVPVCEGCREMLVQLSGPTIRRPRRPVDLSLLPTEELVDMFEELLEK